MSGFIRNKIVSPLIAFIIFVTLLTISHGSFLVYARKHSAAPAVQRMRWWQIHLTVNGILWIAAFVWIVALQFVLPRVDVLDVSRAIGITMAIVGILIVGYTRHLLGREQAMGVRFFFPERLRRVNSSLYRYLRNPMYDGFLLVLVGLGLSLGIQGDYLLAVVSFVLLNVSLAQIENFQVSINPF